MARTVVPLDTFVPLGTNMVPHGGLFHKRIKSFCVAQPTQKLG
jgi:hypothetical protein